MTDWEFDNPLGVFCTHTDGYLALQPDSLTTRQQPTSVTGTYGMTESDTLMEHDDATIREALRFASIEINGIYDLVNTSASYEAALPVLAQMLSRTRHPRIKEGLARALTVRTASLYTPQLIRAFENTDASTPQERSAKWAIGNAISVAARDVDIPKIIALIQNKNHGASRMMLPAALARAKVHRAEAIAALLAALNDEPLIPAAAAALAKLRVKGAIQPLRELANHSDSAIRKAATRAIVRLEREYGNRHDR
ncbi:MAG: hypothetical protein ACTHQM_23815, partial [Thermoanaerobaculia bacterium]